MVERTLTAREIAELPAVVDAVTAGRLLGIGRTRTYQLLRTGRFPVPVFRVGARWRVPTAGICRLLGLAYPPRGDVPAPPASMVDPRRKE